MWKSASGDRIANKIQIAVRDHGPGLPDKELNNIFRPFYRVSDSRERQTGGTGLGLSISERAVHLHHGTISAEKRGRWRIDCMHSLADNQ